MTLPVLERLGVLVPKIVKQRSLSISIADYPDGVHAVGDIFFRKTNGHDVAWVVSRICDHAGGKLILRNDIGFAICPMHGWRLNLDTLDYVNVPEKKAGASVRVEGRCSPCRYAGARN